MIKILCTANGTASGGICAVNNGGTIENSAVDNVAVSGGTAGGICGQNSGTITDCFFPAMCLLTENPAVSAVPTAAL